MPDDPSLATPAPVAAKEPPLPSANGPEAPSEEEGSPSPAGVEWVTPRRIAVIVAFGISLAFYFATAAGLLQVKQSLPVGAGFAIAAGIAEVPSMVLFVAGLERRGIAAAPLLLLSAGAGLESYFVGGSVGVASSATLGGAVITVVLFLMLGHRAKESRRRRVRRVHRWSRNGAILGMVLLILAFGVYTSYTTATPVQALADGTLTDGTVLLPGSHALTSATVTGAAGDVIFLQLGASNTSLGVTGTILNAAGNPMANVTAGNFSSPNAVFLDLRVDPGTYSIEVSYPAGSGGQPAVEVRWGVGDIPAALQAETGILFSAGYVGFVLVIVGAMLWFVTRTPEEPAPPAPPAAGASGAGPASEASPSDALLEKGTPAPSEPSSEGSTRTEGVKPETSDEGMTKTL
jgi:hypothetical protein